MPRILPVRICWAAILLVPVLYGGDLATYRDFRLGSSLPLVLEQTGVPPTDVRTIHQTPALIQELELRPHSLSGSLLATDPVSQMQLSFYNGELFRIVVTYDHYRTQGLTTGDMIQSLSAIYGVATSPDGEQITLPALFDAKVDVIARWEDPRYSINLVRHPGQTRLGLVALLKQTEASARAAALESVRLEEQDAPRREMERQKRLDDERLTQQEKSRKANKPNFRP